MSKRMLATAAALMMLVLAACQNPGASSAPANQDEFSKNPVRTEVTFAFQDMADYMCLMAIEPPYDGGNRMDMAVNIPNDYDIDALPDTEYNANYSLFHYESKKPYATIHVQTAPKDLAAHYGVQDKEKITDLMKADFFPVDDKYESLKKSIIEDFGYELAVDWTGTAYGWKAYYMEFIDKDSNNRGLRFYFGNDELNENFYSLEYKANVPIGDEKLLQMCREVIFSLQQL